MYTVMIAEDELLVRMGLNISVPWETLGLKVVAALEDGTSAWEAYGALKPDVVLTDLRMPGIDGTELIERIRKDDHRCQIIVITCLEEFDVLYRLMQLQVTGYLLKATMSQSDIENQLRLAVRNLAEQDRQNPAEPVSENEDSLFSSFILGHRDPERFRLECSRCGKEPEFPEVGIILQMDSDAQNPVIQLSIRNIFAERIVSFGRSESFCEQNNLFLFLMEPIGRRGCELSALLRELIQYARDILNVPLRALLCTIGGSGEKLFPILDVACSVLQDHWFFPDELNFVDSLPLAMPQRLTEQLLLLREKAQLMAWKFPEQKKSFCSGLLQLNQFPAEPEAFRQTVAALLKDYAACFPEDSAQNSDSPGLAVQSAVSAEDALLVLARELCCEPSTTHTLYGKKILKTMHFIREHAVENLTLSQMADMVALSPNYYASLFKQTAGCSFSEYIGNVRIEKACELLSGSTLSIQKISSLCGFSDTTYFTRYFKQKVGTPPHQWRTKQ